VDHTRNAIRSDRLELDDPALVAAVQSIVREVMAHRTPVSVLPGLLRSHLRLDDALCFCGCEEEWAGHVTRVLERSGMICDAF
jgi:hypothetical protein